jgi:hypothetical protein
MTQIPTDKHLIGYGELFSTSTGSESTTASRGHWNTDKCIAVWILLLEKFDSELVGVGERTAWARRLLSVERRFDTLYSETYGLGVQLRWNIANSVLKKEPLFRKRWDALKSDLHRDFFGLGYLPVGNSVRQRDTLAEIALSPRNLANACALIGEMLAARAPSLWKGRVFTVDDFLCQAQGEKAVKNFERFLLTGQRPPIGVDQLLRHAPFADELRGPFLVNLFKRLDSKHDGRPIIAVRIDGSPMEMCALGHRIFKEVTGKNDPRPIFLIPCSKQMPGHGYRGLDFLVYNISNFLEQKPVAEHPPKLSSEEIAERILAIRAALAKQPAIIVFVGYMATSQRYRHLWHAIKDKAVTELLVQLSQPYIGEPGTPVDAANFLNSHFVVLADGEPEMLNAYCSASLTLPHPPLGRGSVFQFVSEHAARHAALLRRSVQRARRAIREDDLMGYIQLLTLAEHDQIDSLEHLVRVPERVADKLVHGLRTYCTARELLMVRIIAASGTGVRPLTLWRCTQMFERALASIDAGTLPPYLVFAKGANSGFHQIEGLLFKCRFILASGADEPFRELDEEHPFEYPDMPTPVRGEEAVNNAGARPQSIDLQYAAIRNAILRDLDKEPVPWVLYLIQEVLALESFRQQAIISRHGLGQPSLRAFQRALQGYFHGMLSLPAATHWETLSDWPSAAAGSVLPNGPVQRFRFLYDVILRRLLEDNDARRMSLEWAADEIKKDMLRLAHSAFQADIRTSPLSFGHTPLWAVPGTLSNELVPWFEGHVESVTAVISRTDDVEQWIELRLLLEREMARLSGLQHPFSIAGRAQLDLAAIQHGPDARESMQECAAMLGNLGCDPALFENGPWADSDDINYILDPQEFDTFCEAVWQTLSEAAQPQAIAAGLARHADLKYQTIESLSPALRWLASIEAYSMLLIARRLLQANAAMARDWRFPGLSAQGNRVMARTGMEMMRHLSTWGSKYDIFPARNIQLWLDRLAREVRQVLDMYTFSSATTPDRASMLVLESRYARTVGASDSRGAVMRHLAAMQWLNEAENLMVRFHPRPRLRIRFLVERCATLRGMARELLHTREPQLADAMRLLELVKLDLRQLHQIVNETYASDRARVIGRTWRNMCERQQELTDGVEQNALSMLKRLGDGSSPCVPV